MHVKHTETRQSNIPHDQFSFHISRSLPSTRVAEQPPRRCNQINMLHFPLSIYLINSLQLFNLSKFTTTDCVICLYRCTSAFTFATHQWHSHSQSYSPVCCVCPFIRNHRKPTVFSSALSLFCVKFPVSYKPALERRRIARSLRGRQRRRCFTIPSRRATAEAKGVNKWKKHK